MMFGEIFLLLEGWKNIFLSASISQFIIIGTAKIFKIGQQITLLWQKKVLSRNFALAREIIHDHEYSFYAIFLT